MKDNDNPITEKELDDYLSGTKDSEGWYGLYNFIRECGPIQDDYERLAKKSNRRTEATTRETI